MHHFVSQDVQKGAKHVYCQLNPIASLYNKESAWSILIYVREKVCVYKSLNVY